MGYITHKRVLTTHKWEVQKVWYPEIIHFHGIFHFHKPPSYPRDLESLQVGKRCGPRWHVHWAGLLSGPGGSPRDDGGPRVRDNAGETRMTIAFKGPMKNWTQENDEDLRVAMM